MAANLNQRLHDLIESYVQSEFSDFVVNELRVESGFDADGDEIVSIVIVFGEPPQTIKIGSVTRALWSKLSKSDFEHFPIFSFMTAEENARLGAAA